MRALRRKTTALFLAGALGLGLAACDDTPLEDDIEQDIEEGAEDAASEVGEAVEDAGSELEDLGDGDDGGTEDSGG